MQSQKVVNEVLGSTLLENGDGSYTIVFPDQSTETFGQYLKFTGYQADMSFYDSVDAYNCREDYKYYNSLLNQWRNKNA